MKLDSNTYKDPLSKSNKLFRFTFQVIWSCIGFFLPGKVLNGIKRGLINLFGGECDKGSVIYSSCKIFDPRNLSMRSGSTVGPYSIIHNVDSITIGNGSIISQYAHLSTASHDFRKENFPLIHASIDIGSNCWIATEVFINKGVYLCDEVIVGARSSVFKSIYKPGVYIGSPAKLINP